MSDGGHVDHPLGRSWNREQSVVYRRPGISAEHIRRFVDALLRELFEGDDSHYYDAVHVAYLESGVHPLTSLTCEAIHFDTLIERLNRLADHLRLRLMRDGHLQRAVSAVVTTVLNEWTTIAPVTHLTSAELASLAQCCAPGSTTHIDDYDVYAARVAHLASCVSCERRATSVADSDRMHGH